MVKCDRCGVEIADSFELCPNCGNDLTQKPKEESQNQSSTNTCPKCGNSLKSDAFFCPECGTKVDVTESKESHKSCPNCGGKLDADAVFCDNCGFDLKNNKKQVKNNIGDLIAENSKIVILAAAVLVLIVVLCCLVGFSSSNSLVNVTEVGIYDDYSGGPFGGAIDSAIAEREDAAQNPSTSLGGLPSSSAKYKIRLGVKINLMPYDTIEDVDTIQFKNLEIIYSDGSIQKLKDVSFDGGGDLVKDSEYPFAFNYNLNQTLWNESIHLKDFYGKAHVNADIVANTTSETDKVIGHIDNDVTASG